MATGTVAVGQGAPSPSGSVADQPLPVLAHMGDADHREVVRLHPIDDHMRFVGVKPDRRIDLGPLPGDQRVLAEQRELLSQPAEIAVRLVRRPGLRRKVPDALEILLRCWR